MYLILVKIIPFSIKKLFYGTLNSKNCQETNERRNEKLHTIMINLRNKTRIISLGPFFSTLLRCVVYILRYF